MTGNPTSETTEGGAYLEACPYCKGKFPRNLPLVNGETQLERHVKVFHRQYLKDA